MARPVSPAAPDGPCDLCGGELYIICHKTRENASGKITINTGEYFVLCEDCFEERKSVVRKSMAEPGIYVGSDFDHKGKAWKILLSDEDRTLLSLTQDG